MSSWVEVQGFVLVLILIKKSTTGMTESKAKERNFVIFFVFTLDLK